MKIYGLNFVIVSFMLLLLQACSDSSPTSKEDLSSTEEGLSSGEVVSSTLNASSSQVSASVSSSAVSSSSTGVSNSSSEALSSSADETSSSGAATVATLIGSCDKPFTSGPNGSYCNELWSVNPISADSVTKLVAAQKNALALACNSEGVDAFQPGIPCDTAKAVVGCQIDAPKDNGDSLPPSISILYGIAEDEAAVTAMSTYYNTMEQGSGSPCANNEVYPQTVILDNRPAAPEGLGCFVADPTFGDACMKFTDAVKAAQFCGGLQGEQISNCSETSVVLTCVGTAATVLYYNAAKAPPNCN